MIKHHKQGHSNKDQTLCMSTFLLHQTVIEQIDKFRKLCLWRGADVNARQKPKAALANGLQSKEWGWPWGFRYKTQSEALLIKHLHEFFNKEDIPWVSLIWEKYYDNGRLPGELKKGSFWWRDVIKLLDKNKGMANVQLNNGKSFHLWEDLWENELMSNKFPELFSFAMNRTKFCFYL